MTLLSEIFPLPRFLTFFLDRVTELSELCYRTLPLHRGSRSKHFWDNHQQKSPISLSSTKENRSVLWVSMKIFRRWLFSRLHFLRRGGKVWGLDLSASDTIRPSIFCSLIHIRVPRGGSGRPGMIGLPMWINSFLARFFVHPFITHSLVFWVTTDFVVLWTKIGPLF